MEIKEFLRQFAKWYEQERKDSAPMLHPFTNYTLALERSVQSHTASADLSSNLAHDAYELLKFANKLREVSLE